MLHREFKAADTNPVLILRLVNYAVLNIKKSFLRIIEVLHRRMSSVKRGRMVRVLWSPKELECRFCSPDGSIVLRSFDMLVAYYKFSGPCLPGLWPADPGKRWWNALFPRSLQRKMAPISLRPMQGVSVGA
jgi:hypothetical protein